MLTVNMCIVLYAYIIYFMNICSTLNPTFVAKD